MTQDAYILLMDVLYRYHLAVGQTIHFGGAQELLDLYTVGAQVDDLLRRWRDGPHPATLYPKAASRAEGHGAA